jgi:hypothetical protein
MARLQPLRTTERSAVDAGFELTLDVCRRHDIDLVFCYLRPRSISRELSSGDDHLSFQLPRQKLILCLPEVGVREDSGRWDPDAVVAHVSERRSIAMPPVL